MPRRFPLFFVASFALALGAFCVTLAMSASADETPVSYARIVRLSVVRGDVQIARAETGKWEPAALNMPLEQGFAVGTNMGLAEIELEHGSVIWVAPNSMMQFTDLSLSSEGQITKVQMDEGTVTYDASVGSHDNFSVSNANFDVTPEGKSEFRVDITKDGVGLTVLKGKVTFQSKQGTQTVSKGEMYFLGVRKPEHTGASAAPKVDEWDKFVKDRMEYITAASAATSQYTTAPFNYGMADLSTYGSWSFIPGVGYAWQPGGVGADWVPFSNGSMMFYDGFGWTWVGAEPWGWVPYHFGSWTYAAGNGWRWLPGNYSQWAAAPVSWVTSGNKIGWTALRDPQSSAQPKTTSIVLAKGSLSDSDSYKVIKSLKSGQTIAPLAGMPGANGKIGTVSETRLVVPTAHGLSMPSQGVSESVVKAVAGNPALAHPASQISTLPQLASMHNGLGSARMMTSRPPLRVSTMGADFYSAGPTSGGFAGRSSAGASSAASRAAASESAAHGGAAAGGVSGGTAGGGHPR